MYSGTISRKEVYRSSTQRTTGRAPVSTRFRLAGPLTRRVCGTSVCSRVWPVLQAASTCNYHSFYSSKLQQTGRLGYLLRWRTTTYPFELFSNNTPQLSSTTNIMATNSITRGEPATQACTGCDKNCGKECQNDQ